ncbi:MAG: hypothetical protein ACJA01_000992 [Saprospiraceae bacterium]|jgi:hypothetical protein
MNYNITEFVVQAGKPIELVLDNIGIMQYNLIIIMSGTQEKVGAADKLATNLKQWCKITFRRWKRFFSPLPS